MNYIKQIRAFWAWRILNRISSSEADLYMAILNFANSSFWQKNLHIPNDTLMFICNLPKTTFWRTRKKLIAYGLISYETTPDGGFYNVTPLYSDNEYAKPKAYPAFVSAYAPKPAESKEDFFEEASFNSEDENIFESSYENEFENDCENEFYNDGDIGYETYCENDYEAECETVAETVGETDVGTGCGTLYNNIYNNIINNNINNKYKNINKKINKTAYRDNVFLSEEEYNTVLSDYGYERCERILDKLSLYKKSSGREYASDFAAIKNWVAGAVPDKCEEKKSSYSSNQYNSYEVFEDNYDHEALAELTRRKFA